MLACAEFEISNSIQKYLSHLFAERRVNIIRKLSHQGDGIHFQGMRLCQFHFPYHSNIGSTLYERICSYGANSFFKSRQHFGRDRLFRETKDVFVKLVLAYAEFKKSTQHTKVLVPFFCRKKG